MADDNPFDALDTPPDDPGAFLTEGPRPGLGERFRINARAGLEQGTLVGAGRTWENPARRQRFDAAYEAFPDWNGTIEGATALAGQVVGSIPSPENFIPVGLGAKLLGVAGLGTEKLAARVFAGAVDAAATNAAVDAALQGAEIATGVTKDFSAPRLGIAAGAGAIIGGGFGAAGAGLDRLRTRGAPEAAADTAATGEPAAAPEAALSPEAADAVASAGDAAAAPEPPAGLPEPEAIGDILAGTPGEALDIRRPQRLSEFVASHGGLRPDPGGDLAAMDLGRLFLPGYGRLLRTSGLALDHAREVAAEAGFFSPAFGPPEEAIARTTVADFLDLLDRDMRQKDAFNEWADGDQLRGWQAQQAAKEHRTLVRQTRERVDAEAEAGGWNADTPFRQRVADLMIDEDLDLDDAFERATMEWYREHGDPPEKADTDIDDAFDSLATEWDSDPAASPGRPDNDEAPFLRAPAKGAAADAGPAAPAGGPDRLLFRRGDGSGTPARAGGDSAQFPHSRASARGEGGQGSDVLARRGALTGELRRADAGTASTPGADTPQFGRLRDVTNALSDALDVAATRQGRMPSGKGALGIYHSGTGVIRVRNVDDFDVWTHEVGHHLDYSLGKSLGNLIRRYAPDLRPLAYAGADPAHLVQEGFAEWFRLFVTNEAYARKAAPGFSAAFETFMRSAHPDILAAIGTARSAWRAWITLPSRQAVASGIVSARPPGWLSATWADMRRHGWRETIADMLEAGYAFLFDGLHPINRAVQALKGVHLARTGQHLDLKAADDAYVLARMSRGAWTAGQQDILYGVQGYRQTRPGSPSLRDALIEATGAPNVLARWDSEAADAFGSYLWSRRALGEWDRFDAGEIPNPPDKFTRGDHEVNIRELEAAHPTFQSAAEKVYGWNLALWAKKRDAGLISEAQYHDGLAIRDYVPGLRAFDQDGDPAGVTSGKRAGSAKHGFVRRFRGSTRDVVNPVESLIADAYQTASWIARNDVVKALDRLALTAGRGGGAIAERIPARELKGLVVDPLEAVEAAAREAGLAKADVTVLRDALEASLGDARATIWRPAIINEKGETIAFFRDAGELKALRLADGQFGLDMYKALTGMAPQEKNLLLSVFAKGAAVVRAGITTTPEFLIANAVRDMLTSFIFYGKPFQRIRATFGGAADELLSRDAARAYNAAGGIMGGANTASLHDLAVSRDLSVLARKGWSVKRLPTFKGFFEAMELSETSMRLGLFRTFLKEAEGRGLSDWEATLEAAWRARDYIDFDRRGSGMAALARVIPFLNASLQGLDKTVRHMGVPLLDGLKILRKKPVTPEEEKAFAEALKAQMRLGVVAVMGLSLHALMSRFPDYDEISETTRATHWMVKAGPWWIAVPKPYEAAVVLNAMEALWDGLARRDPTAAGRYLDGLFDVLAPPSLMFGNPIVSSAFELWANKDSFTGNPIVPPELEGLEPWMQYTAKTSELGRLLGKASGQPPVIIDHLVTSLGATWGRSLLALSDGLTADRPDLGPDDMPFLRRFVKSAARGARSTQELWRMVSQRTGTFERAASTWDALMDQGAAGDAADYLATLPTEQRAFVISRSADADVKRAHPLIRARLAVQAIGALRREIVTGRITTADGLVTNVPSAARGAADDILDSLAMVEARNTLILLGEPGWAGKAMTDTGGYYRELTALSPEIARALADRYATKKVVPFAPMAAIWPELRQRLLDEGSDSDFADLTGDLDADGFEFDGTRIPKRTRAAVPAPG